MICSVCMGRRKLLGLGAMIKDCDACNGTGVYYPQDEVKIKPAGPRQDRTRRVRRTNAQIELDKMRGA